MPTHERALFGRLKPHALVLAAVVATSALTASAEPTLRWPARSSDLAPNAYWSVTEFSEGCCKLDLNVHQWNGSAWKAGAGSNTNEQDFIFGIPLYSPAHGEIVSCWRNNPDNLAPGEDHPDDGQIFGGGNHLVIRTRDDHLIAMRHLQAGSIPPELCPPNAGSAKYPRPKRDKEAWWHPDAYVEPDERPRVIEGQFLGRVGNSGTQSSGPHLHIGYFRLKGKLDSFDREAVDTRALPMPIRHAWAHRYEKDEKDSTDGWVPLRGDEFTGNGTCKKYQPDSPECGFKLLHASPFLRRADVSGGAVKETSTLFITRDRVITATVGAVDNRLKLMAWDLDGVDSIVRRGDATAGAARRVFLGEPLRNHVLAAVQQPDLRLKMIAYRVTKSGALNRVDDVLAGEISGLDMATTLGDGDRKSVTAVRDAQGNLKLITWDIVTSADGTARIVRLGQASAGAVSALAISRAAAFRGMFTAVRDGQGELKVIPWTLSEDGTTLTRGGSMKAGAVSKDFDVAPLQRGVAVAMRDSDQRLRVITWTASAEGDVVRRRGTLVAGEARNITLLPSRTSGSNLTAVLRGADDRLYVIGYAVNANGTNLRRVGSSRAGKAWDISAHSVSRSYPGNDSRDMVLTALRANNGDLKLITWDANLVTP